MTAVQTIEAGLGRVEIPAYTDRWMMGDRYGEVTRLARRRKNFPPNAPVSADARGTYVEIAYVRLDKSGNLVRVFFEDCKLL